MTNKNSLSNEDDLTAAYMAGFERGKDSYKALIAEKVEGMRKEVASISRDLMKPMHSWFKDSDGHEQYVFDPTGEEPMNQPKTLEQIIVDTDFKESNRKEFLSSVVKYVFGDNFRIIDLACLPVEKESEHLWEKIEKGTVDGKEKNEVCQFINFNDGWNKCLADIRKAISG